MPQHDGPVLVDTNVILECWRVSAWQALTGGYRVETVEDCVIETQTGFQRRRAAQQIDKSRLLASLATVHPPRRCVIRCSRRSMSASVRFGRMR
jgi:hypothetical protein